MMPIPSASAVRNNSKGSRLESSKSVSSSLNLSNDQQRRGGQTRQSKGQTPIRNTFAMKEEVTSLQKRH
jgi:hypothetical protein